jgi:hypothetical protein
MKWRLMGAMIVAVGMQSLRADVEILWGVTGVGGSSSSLYAINPTSGQVIAKIGDTGMVNLSGLVMQPGTGELFAAQGNMSGTEALLRINKSTAQATIVGTMGQAISDTAFRASGELYAWGAASKKLYTVNPSSGGLTQLGNTVLSPIGSVGLTFGSNGTLYLVRSNSFITVNLVNGTIASGPVTITGGNLGNMLATNSSGVIYGASRNVQSAPTTLYTLNVTTGALTKVATISDLALTGMAFDIVPTPSLTVNGKKKIVTKRPTILLKGTATSVLPLTVSTKGKSTTAASGAWSLKLKLKRGRNVFVISGVDALGQSASGGRVTVIRRR